MRFQILSQYYTPEVTAASLRLQALTDELIRRGHDVDVVTAMPNHPKARIFDGYRGRLLMTEQRDGAQVHRVWIYAANGRGIGRIVNYLSFALLALVPMARTKRPDAVLVESPPLLAVVPAMIDRVLRRRRFVMIVADLYPDTAIQMGLMSNRVIAWLFHLVERWAYRLATLIAPVTEHQVEVIRDVKGVPASKVVLTPNGVDLDLFVPGQPSDPTNQLLRPNGERVVIFAGTVGYAQNLDVVLDATGPVRAVHPDVRFVIVGAGSDWDRVQARVVDEDIEGVLLLAARPPEEIADFYKAVFAGITSVRDTPVSRGARPSKIFPMMSAELPVIYCGSGEGERLVTDANAGVSAPSGDATALADVIIKLLDDPDAAKEMGRNGRRLVAAKFAWSRIMVDFVNHLEKRKS